MISNLRQVLSWRIILTLGLLGASFLGAQWQWGPSRLSREPNGYYAELTEAFLAGQLHLKAKPDPRLATLANPYAGDQGVPKPTDVSYFNNRFYLYFGTPPVFLLFAPFPPSHRFLSPGWNRRNLLWPNRLWRGGLAAAAPANPSFPTIGGELGDGWPGCLVPSQPAQLLAYTNIVFTVPINCAFACLTAAVASKVKKSEFVGIGPAIQAIGLISCFIAFPFGVVAEIILTDRKLDWPGRGVFVS